MKPAKVSENLLVHQTFTEGIPLGNEFRNTVSDDLFVKKFRIFMISGKGRWQNNKLAIKGDLDLVNSAFIGRQHLNNSFGDEHLDEVREVGAIIWWNE